MNAKEQILKQLAENPIIIYMKGVPTAPECGFSAKATEILTATKVPYAFVNVLMAPFIREKLPSVSKWPTFPQLFVNGELVGGADIIEALYHDGSLTPMLRNALTGNHDSSPDTAISPSEVIALIRAIYEDAEIHIDGEGCDLTIIVVSSAFADQPMIKQHQGVMATLSEPLASGRLHAVTLKTYTPGQWQMQKPAASPGLLQIQL